MAVTVIVELRAEPDRRDELKNLLHPLIAEMGPTLKDKGSLGSTLHEMLDDPDVLVEIAECDSAEARDALMHDRPSPRH